MDHAAVNNRAPVTPAVVELAPAQDTASAVTLGAIEFLDDLLREYVLFTPALLLTCGGFDREPIGWLADQPGWSAKSLPLALDLPGAVFSGLGISTVGSSTISWDTRLYASPAVDWVTCRESLLRLIVAQRPYTFVARFAWHTLRLPAWRYMRHPVAGEGSVPVVSFAASTTRGFFCVAEDGMSPPYLKRSRPREDILELSRVMQATFHGVGLDLPKVQQIAQSLPA